MRLGGWTRVGIVASVLWAVVGGGYIFLAEQGKVSDQWFAYMGMCDSHKHEPNYNYAGCVQQANEYRQQIQVYVWPSTLGAALFPIPIAWLLVWIVVRTTTWVATGFRKSASD